MDCAERPKLTDRHELTYGNQKLQGKSTSAIGGSVERMVRRCHLVSNYKNRNNVGVLDRKACISIRAHGISHHTNSLDTNLCKHVPVTIVRYPIHAKPHRSVVRLKPDC